MEKINLKIEELRNKLINNQEAQIDKKALQDMGITYSINDDGNSKIEYSDGKEGGVSVRCDEFKNKTQGFLDRFKNNCPGDPNFKDKWSDKK